MISELTPKPGAIKNLANIDSLAEILDTTPHRLTDMSRRVREYWKPGANLPKSDGTVRATNDAKMPLKHWHRLIKSRILAPCFYPHYLHGSLQGRSIYSNGVTHTNSKILLNEDVKSFFPSTTFSNVKSVWKYFFNCNEKIADILTKLTTFDNSLPQGWITSSYIANLVFWDLEGELVLSFHKRGFRYTRLVDDITVSTQHKYSSKDLNYLVSAINQMLRTKGYALNRGKHSLAPNYSRQSVNNQLVNNAKVGIPTEKRQIIRAQVHRLESDFSCGMSCTDIYKIKWRSVCQRVGLLKNGHISKRNKLRKRLRAIRPETL